MHFCSLPFIEVSAVAPVDVIGMDHVLGLAERTELHQHQKSDVMMKMIKKKKLKMVVDYEL